MIKAGIIGGNGYTGGELLRLLYTHPNVKVSWVFSRSHDGAHVSTIHSDFEGRTDLRFTSSLSWKIDVVFLCLPHGISKPFLADHAIPKGVKIIDLSRDFRLNGAHEFIYGLPELNREEIRKASRVANPGCFATAISLSMLPLANGDVGNNIYISGITGATGAGKKLQETTHFTWRESNVSVYKGLRHQHITEIKRNIEQLNPHFDKELLFVPMRGNFTRGILVSTCIECSLDEVEVRKLFQEYYDNHPFVVISQNEVNIKEVVQSNFAKMSIEDVAGHILIVCVIDNLLKGASGQAVQNMNLMFGLPEVTGLAMFSIGY